MRTSVLAVPFLALVPVLSLFAFDADAWNAKREDMSREAARLKGEYVVYSAKVQKPATDVTIPVETFKSGDVKSIIFARQGQFFLDKGYVWAQGVTAEQYKEDGSLDMRLTADYCLVDRQRKCTWISGHVKAFHRKTTLEGDDAFFCSSNSFLKVMSNAKIVSEDVKMKGLRL